MKKWLGTVFARMAGVDIEKQAVLLKAQDDRISALQEEISNVKETTVIEGANIKAKDAQIEKLKKEIDNLKKSTEDKELDARQKDSQISALETELAGLQQKLGKLEEEISSSEPEEVVTPSETNAKANSKKKSSKSDPYERISQDLVNALKMTTKGKEPPEKGKK